MKHYKGQTHNIAGSIYARVDARHKDLYILNSMNGSCFISGHELAETESYFECKDIFLNVGDIVVISEIGVCSVIHPNSSAHVLYLTDGCNNACVMCPQLIKNVTTYINDIKEVIPLLQPISPTVITITGGEPTIVWDDLVFTLKLISEYLPDTQVHLLTNGRVFNQRNKVKEIIEANSRILFCIPLYSEVEKIHNYMVGNEEAFNETLEGLYNLAMGKQSIEIRNVVTSLNYKRLAKWARWVTYNLPFISHIAVMGIEIIHNAHKHIDELRIDPVTYSEQLVSTAKVFSRASHLFYIYNHPLCIVDKSLHKFCVKSISEHKIIYKYECNECTKRQDCGGLFVTNKNYNTVVPMTEV